MRKVCDFSSIRLICSDIDGTLLRGEKEIPQYVKDEIGRLHQKGIIFTFATGRLPYEVDHLFDGLPEKTPYVAGNGAVIKCGDKILVENSFKPDVLRDLAYKYSNLGMTIIFSYDNAERPLVVTPWSKENASVFPGLDIPAESDIWDRKIQRMFFLHPEGNFLKECRTELGYFEGCFDIRSQNNISVQIAPQGCTKASGVKQLANELGIPKDAIMCIGDAENDIPMIEYAGIGVAVANATDSLKSAADYVANAQCTQGVAEILQLCGHN